VLPSIGLDGEEAAVVLGQLIDGRAWVGPPLAFEDAKLILVADSITVTYMKMPAINITQRLMPFIRADGIDVPNAEVPPGTHQIRIELKYTDGGVGGKIFTIQVAN
jgi:hypothetical protein